MLLWFIRGSHGSNECTPQSVGNPSTAAPFASILAIATLLPVTSEPSTAATVPASTRGGAADSTTLASWASRSPIRPPDVAHDFLANHFDRIVAEVLLIVPWAVDAGDVGNPVIGQHVIR